MTITGEIWVTLDTSLVADYAAVSRVVRVVPYT